MVTAGPGSIPAQCPGRVNIESDLVLVGADRPEGAMDQGGRSESYIPPGSISSDESERRRTSQSEYPFLPMVCAS